MWVCNPNFLIPTIMAFPPNIKKPDCAAGFFEFFNFAAHFCPRNVGNNTGN
jgi:hypothetical protein